MSEAFERSWGILKASMAPPPPDDEENWDDENPNSATGISNKDFINEWLSAQGIMTRTKSNRPKMPFGPRGPRNPDGSYSTDVNLHGKPDATKPAKPDATPASFIADSIEEKNRIAEEETHGLNLDPNDPHWKDMFEASSDRAFTTVWDLLKLIA